MTPRDDSPPASARSGTSQPPKANASEPAPKRRRVALACSACRIRKSRCNGVRPRCDTCDKLGFDCSYEQQETSANLLVPKDIFAALEAKVKLLEANIEQHNVRLSLVEGTLKTSEGSRQDVTLPLHHQPGNVVVNIDEMPENGAGQSMTDGMAVSFVDEQDCGFFGTPIPSAPFVVLLSSHSLGPSSNIALMRHILRAVDTKRTQQGNQTSLTPASEYSAYEGGLVSNLNAFPAVSSESQKAGANLLPPDEVMQRLIRAYFDNTGLLFPYIHEQEFLDTYERFRASGFRGNVRRTWLGLLNMILAMATCTSCWEDSGSETTFEESDVYYRRAQELCHTQMFRGTTLETVQYLLLTSQYLQGTHKSVHTWTIHGLAVKAAMSIGLHSRDIASKFTPLQQEIRKRTWFGCILLDRLVFRITKTTDEKVMSQLTQLCRSLSLTFGRPSAIPEEYIRLDLPKILPVPIPASDEVHKMSTAFYNASITLYRIMGRIIGSLYGSNLGCEDQSSDTATMTSMIQFGQELSDWQNSLPQHLGLRSVDNMPDNADENIQDPLREKFRIILTLRYLNVQLLLHRPIFIRSLGTLLREAKTPYRNAGSINSMHANFDRVFVQVAENIIDIIYTILTRPDHGRHFIGAWWFTLYYAFSAALAIFGSLLISLGAEAGNAGRLESAKRYLGKTCEALLKLSDNNTLVLRCVKFVQQLLRIVSAWDASTATRADLNSDSLGSYLTAEGGPLNFDMESDLLSTMPTWETSTLGFGDELELGHFFASDSQRWFEQTQW
ncbi:C6 transcription factor [Fusarium globosum]|uniref:C6 transcription factor n=1 Tax=Fusarium globosum TaxID=78864 RepID=A0A8H6DCG7_9HYPO|nr:C6 transcription factor [Fusarium globosum]